LTQYGVQLPASSSTQVWLAEQVLLPHEKPPLPPPVVEPPVVLELPLPPPPELAPEPPALPDVD
jgi:hypothetical protein